MNVLLKTAEQVCDLLGSAFEMPADSIYLAICNGADVLVGVSEPMLMAAWATVGLAQLCDVLSALITETQATPGLPVVYGPEGFERRAKPRLWAVAS